ncbi:hypothetical protein BX666DRAFT_2031292 [Dichotomocladium elegans]|nr:hypothetical protein BX666DRAFT_2031292 [Dichotomocladium elegans]
MGPAPCIKKEGEDTVSCLDSSSLDDWLEHDLRASGLLGTVSEPLTTIKPEGLPESGSCSSSQPQQQHFSFPIGAIIRAFAALIATQQHQPVHPPATVDKKGVKRTSSGSKTSDERRIDDQLKIKKDAAMRRQRNTDAARRSRLRKAQKMEGLEQRVKKLQVINGRLVVQLAVLQKECAAVRRKHDRQEQRVHELEARLAEAHEALIR